MIKAVFFDLYHTLVRYEPPREDLQSAALKEFGITAQPADLLRPIVAADEFIYTELARQPMSQRSDEDRMALWARYQQKLLAEAGIPATESLVRGLLGKMAQAKMKLVLFDDVAPALTGLKGRGLTLGLISNIDKDMTATLRKLGLLAWLEIIVMSVEVGFSKPQPEIFHEALKRARVAPGEAIFTGDQYQVDALGACRAGLKGVLLDRGYYYKEVNDCPRIRSLNEITSLL
ncbi:MAG: HAD family hydrolase [Dehalococcoidales bacterium]|nr:HAD family hydrolase [Dehalococcoidales bacterium]